MELIQNLGGGMLVALQPTNIFFCFAGVLLGTLIGVLPGVGPLATIAMLLPMTFGLPPETAIITLAGIYYGSQYGGSTTAILVNVPGESSSLVTTIDGYQLALQGKAGEALAIAAIGSFVAGCFATVVVGVASVPLTELARHFGAAEYFSLMLLGLICAVVMASGSVIRSFVMILAGLALGLVGLDVATGAPRMTFGSLELADGIDFAPLAMGVFGIVEVIRNLERQSAEGGTPISKPIGKLLPSRAVLRQAFPAILRGAGLGSVLGVLPGGGALLASFASYSLEKKLAKDPSRFGKGAIEGVAGPESANNAGAQTSFIPMLTLGMPSNVVMALMIGALAIHGISPGPQVMTLRPELYWGLIASMWVGNAMLLVINLPMVGLWVKLLSVPYKYLFPAIVVFCCVGVYSFQSSVLEVEQLALFALLGYMLYKLNFEPAPMLMGFVLGPMMEENLRRTLTLSDGDPTVFLTRPISAVLVGLCVVMLASVALPMIRRSRRVVFQVDE